MSSNIDKIMIIPIKYPKNLQIPVVLSPTCLDQFKDYTLNSINIKILVQAEFIHLAILYLRSTTTDSMFAVEITEFKLRKKRAQ